MNVIPLAARFSANTGILVNLLESCATLQTWGVDLVLPRSWCKGYF